MKGVAAGPSTFSFHSRSVAGIGRALPWTSTYFSPWAKPWSRA